MVSDPFRPGGTGDEEGAQPESDTAFLRGHRDGKSGAGPLKFPGMTGSERKDRSYRFEKEGFTFVLDAAGAGAVKALPDFEGREEPAVAEEFLRTRAEGWADALASAGAAAGEYSVRVDGHQARAHLSREGVLVFSADL